MAGRDSRIVVACLALALAACAEPALELRRVAYLASGELTPVQREFLGCDPCVRLEMERAFGPVALSGRERPDLVLTAADFVRAELRSQFGPGGSRAVVHDLLLVTRPGVRPQLEALRSARAVQQIAVSFEGRVIALTSPATWPERIFIARYRDPDEVPDLVERFGLAVDRVTPARRGS